MASDNGHPPAPAALPASGQDVPAASLEPPHAPPATKTNRLPVVDGLRALAAPMVAWFHIHGTAQGLAPLLPAWFNVLCGHFGSGVQIFFVVSGFAIAQSLEGITPGLNTLGRFIVRRVIRLDPPFWVSILLAIGTVQLADVLLHRPAQPWPALADVLANATYTQPFFKGVLFMDVYWTLMVEFQFYLAFFFLTWAGHLLAAWQPALRPAPVMLMTLWGWGVHFQGWPLPLDGVVVLQHWHVFALGIACSWLHQKVLPAWCVPALCVATVVAAWLPSSAQHPAADGTAGDLAWDGLQLTVGDVVGLGTALFLWLAFQLRAQERWLGHRVVQWLAAISYSLYLVHPLFGQRLGNIFYRVLGTAGGTPILVSLLSMAASVGAAWVLCRVVEQPAMRLARKVPRQVPAGPATVT